MKNYSKYITFGISFLIALITAFLSISKNPSKIEYMARDSVYQKPSAIPYNVKIIAIDEETLKELGPYTDWNREYFANLINILNVDEDTKPLLIALDIMFTGTNNSIQDKALVNAAKNYGNIIIASSINSNSYIYQDNKGKYYYSTYIESENPPYEELAKVSEYGFTDAIFDNDGVVRRMYTKSGDYESFAYKIASKIQELAEYPSIIEIAYTSNPGDYETIPMAKILDGSVPGSYFDDSIVFVGAYEEGMMDAYKVPIDYSREMYGVEMQANYLNALLNNKVLHTVNPIIQFLLSFFIVFSFAFYSFNNRTRNVCILLPLSIIINFGITIIVFITSKYMLSILPIPVSLLISFFIILLYKYIDMQKKKALEMQNMLFSMAEGFAEAIEGRTPYNANHTKNVALRSVEMLQYINKMHKEKRTDMHFSKADINQIYLAAMLHDVGKMDVPLEVMDKPTKLGSKEGPLRDRLTIISLKIKNDALSGRISKEEADKELEKINVFVGKLGLFNCGKPLNEEEWAIVNGIAESKYIDAEGNETPYLTTEEIDDIHIKAGTLSDNERTIMQSHVVYTDKILSHMVFGEAFKDVRRMASDHHEVLNGKGYPRGIKAEEIDTMTRILTIMDIYDSLIADDRPYKKPKPIPVAFDILDEEAEFGKVDKDLLAIAKEIYLVKEEPKKDSEENFKKDNK